MTGQNKLHDKMKREQRRRNHIVRDLRTPKYRQRKIENKKRKMGPPDEELESLV